MNSLKIDATRYTPEISFNVEDNVLELKGECFPENITKFSAPLFSWLADYLKQLDNQAVTVNIDLAYFNSSTSKMLLDLFDKLEAEVVNNSKNITVNWIYEADNEAIEEYGEEFKEDLDMLTFNLVEKEE